MRFMSQALNREASYVYWDPLQELPLKTAEKRPLLVLLHGLGGSGMDWFQASKGRFQKELKERIKNGSLPPFVVVAPNGKNGYWAKHVPKDGNFAPDYASFVSEVIKVAENHFDASKKRAIAGVSMGGFGALSLAFQKPQEYLAVIALSGAFFPSPPSHRAIYKEVWGDPVQNAAWEASSPSALLQHFKPQDKLPAIFLFCGKEDELHFHNYNKTMSFALREKNITHTFLSTHGRHSWETWALTFPQWLDWLAQEFPHPTIP